MIFVATWDIYVTTILFFHLSWLNKLNSFDIFIACVVKKLVKGVYTFSEFDLT